METRVVQIKDINNDYENIKLAADFLKKGEVVAIPTETVYGLAANIFDINAVKKIFIAKGRPQDNPLIAHICDISQLSEICYDISDLAKKIIEKFWPGSLTIILKKKECVSDVITAGLNTIAVRFPSHTIAQAIIKESGVPLVAPSANLSGKPSTTRAEHCFKDLNEKISLIVDGGACEFGIESTIIDLTTDIPVILRPGAISIEEIKSVLPNIIYEGSEKIKDNEVPKAPGMKYRHYAPEAGVTVVEGALQETEKWILDRAIHEDGILCFEESREKFKEFKHVFSFGNFENPKSNSNKLFDILRKFDDLKVNHIYIQAPQNKGIGNSILNRLNKASAGNIIHLK